MVGYVAAWYVQLEPSAPTPPETTPEPDKPLIVYASQALNVRKGPSTGASRIGIALPHERLAVVGDQETALAKMGDRGEWLRVVLPDGRRGYVAAWYVQTESGPEPADLLVVYPTQDMNMRECPTVRAARVGRPAHNTPLMVHDDPERARVLVGRYDEWLHVVTPEGQRGWVAAWYVSREPT
jgi:N-acetylmuramoyl-L-alanine amidase